MRPYPKYQKTNTDWIGEIPEDWEMMKVKYVFNFNTGFTPSTSESKYYNKGNLDWVTITDLKGKYVDSTENKITELAVNELNKKPIPKGSLMYSFKLSVGKVAFANKQLYTNEAIFSVFSSRDINLEYYYYSLPKQIIYNANENIYGAKILNQELIRNAYIIVPTQQEQTAIATYLDHKTTLIDKLITNNEKQVKLFEEKRKATIEDSLALKKRGIPLKYLVETRKGYAFKSDLFSDTGKMVVKASDIKNNTLLPATTFISEDISLNYKKYTIKENDILLATVGSHVNVINSAVGQIALTPKKREGDFLNQNTVILRTVSKNFLQRYVFHVLTSNKYRKHLDLYAHGTANQASLSLKDILDFELPNISKQDQENIILKIEGSNEIISKQIKLVKKQNTLLKEYRQSLISHVVTGKVDVRDYNKKQI